MAGSKFGTDGGNRANLPRPQFKVMAGTQLTGLTCAPARPRRRFGYAICKNGRYSGLSLHASGRVQDAAGQLCNHHNSMSLVLNRLSFWDMSKSMRIIIIVIEALLEMVVVWCSEVGCQQREKSTKSMPSNNL